jgi:hypothetical protein
MAVEKDDKPYKYYFVGAYVNQDSKALLKVLNPGDAPANIEVKMYYEKNDSGKFSYKIGSHSAASIDLAEYAASGVVFGAVVSSDQSIVVEHVQFDGTYSGGFIGTASTKPGFVWYFGEGYSSGMVKTYLYILNPSDRVANMGVTLYYENGEKKTFNLEVPSFKSEVIDLKEKTMPEKRFGMKVTSTAPVVVEAGDFNKKFSAGSGGMGSQAVAKKWYFAEGYTSADASEFLNILNPGMGNAIVKVTFYDSEGKASGFDETVPANSKKMFMLNNYVEQMEWYSTVVESDVDVAAELTHYDASYSAGHGGLGSTSPSSVAYFSSGLVADKVKGYLALFNPSDKDAVLKLEFFYADGTVKTLESTASKMSRSTIDLNSKAVANVPFGIKLSSSEPVVAQMVVYDSTRSAGYGTFGMRDLVYVEGERVLDEGIEQSQKSAELKGDEGYVLLKEEVVSPSRFNEGVTAGIVDVKKSSYSYKGENVYVWRFSYSDAVAASKALEAVNAGALFKLLEVSPASVSGNDAYRFVADKSEGYVLQQSDAVLVLLAQRGSADAALGLAEIIVSAPLSGNRIGIGWVLLILALLVVLVVFLRWFFRKRGGKKEEELEESEGGWEDVIPSARPKTRHAKPKKKVEAKHDEKKAHRHEEKKHVPEHKHEHASEPKHLRQVHHSRVDPKDVHVREIKEHVEGNVKEEMPEEIPEYEDVFRHVNRDQDEIKQK